MRMGKLKKIRKKMLGAAARTSNRVELLGTRPRAVYSSRSVVVDTEWDLITSPEGTESSMLCALKLYIQLWLIDERKSMWVESYFSVNAIIICTHYHAEY